MSFVLAGEALKSIKQEWFKSRIEASRKKRKAKENLPAFAFGGTFNCSVANRNLNSSSGLFHFDIDIKDSCESVGNDIKQVVSILPFVYSAWLSPNFGVKGLVKVSGINNDADYKVAFSQVNAMLKDSNIEIDQSCKDVRRFCFVCCDKELYFNKNSEVVKLVRTVPPLTTLPDRVWVGTVQKEAIEDRLKKILYNTKDGGFHAARYKAGVVIGGLIAGDQADDTLINVFFEWSMLIHSTFGDSEHIIKRESKTFYDGLKIGKCQPIVDNFLSSKGK